MSRLSQAIKSMLGEFNTRYRGRFYGKYRAVVVDNQDPDQIGRIRVKCPVLFGDAISAWCWPAQPYGGNDPDNRHGMLIIPDQNDMVWIELEEGNVNKPPIWTGSMWSSNSVAYHVQAQPDISDEDGVKGIDGAAIPPSAANFSEYAKVRSWQMPSGSRIEFDETEGEERVHIWHKSGGHLEILPDGTINVGAAGALNLQSTAGRTHVYSAEDILLQAEGMLQFDSKGYQHNIRGNQTHTVAGDYSFAAGTNTWDIAGDWKATIGTADVLVTGKESRQVSNQYSLFVGTDFSALATQKAKLIAQNSLAVGGLFSDLGLELKAQNSRALLQSVDETGFLSEASLYLDGGDPTGATVEGGLLVSGPAFSAELSLSGTTGMVLLSSTLPVSAIQIGSPAAVEPAWLGGQAAILWGLLIGWLDTHTHIAPVIGPTSPPVVPSTTVLTTQVGLCPSQKILLE